MAFNPLKEKGIPIEKQIRSWSELNVRPYDKEEVHPYSRLRGIFMNGIGLQRLRRRIHSRGPAT